MKTREGKCSILLLLCLLLVLSVGCSKDENDPEPLPPTEGGGSGDLNQENDAVSADDFETYQGALGMVFNARNIARKGYKPASAELKIEGSEGNYSQTIELDEISFMGRVEIPIEDLSEAARSELENGIPVEIDVKDGNGQSIYSNTISAVSFASNPAPSEMNVFTLDETVANKALMFNGNRDYLIQIVSESGGVIPRAIRRVANADGIVIDDIGGGDLPDDFDFKIQAVNSNKPGVFMIQHSETGHYLANFETIGIGGGLKYAFLLDVNVAVALNDSRFHFRIIKETEGAYRIRSELDNNYLGVINGSSLFFSTVGSNEEDVYVRFIASGINWSVANSSTSFIAPILPKAQTSFGANSVLTNCTSGGGLSQTVGTNLTEERKDKVGWSESLSITTTNTVGVSTSVSAGFEASFFGVGGSYEASVTANYQYERSVTESSSNFGESEKTTTENVFFERTVTVPPQSASLVYDVAQFYADTKIQVAQKLILTATYPGGQPITGQEMATQLRFSRFDGVINEIGSDFLEISLQGTLTLEKVLETESKVQEVEPDCN